MILLVSGISVIYCPSGPGCYEGQGEMVAFRVPSVPLWKRQNVSILPLLPFYILHCSNPSLLKLRFRVE